MTIDKEKNEAQKIYITEELMPKLAPHIKELIKNITLTILFLGIKFGRSESETAAIVTAIGDLIVMELSGDADEIQKNGIQKNGMH